MQHRTPPSKLLTEGRKRRLRVVDVDLEEAQDKEQGRLAELSDMRAWYPDSATTPLVHFKELADDHRGLLDMEEFDELGYDPTKLKEAYRIKLSKAEMAAKSGLDDYSRGFKNAQAAAKAFRRKNSL